MKSKNKIVKYSQIIIWAFFLVASYSTGAQAATHYVSTNGSASWALSTNINTPCSLATATASANDDDVVFLRGGNYGSQLLSPSNSGSPGHVITFARYQYEQPILQRSTIDSKSHIVFDGLSFYGGTALQVYLNNANYNEIKNCKFEQFGLNGVMKFNYSDYNYIHDNEFLEGNSETVNYSVDTIWIQYSGYNRIINNSFAEGGAHGFIWISYSAHHNVCRGNTISISDYWNAYPGSWEFFGFEKGAYRNLIEKNRCTGTGSALTADAPPSQLNAVSYNIIRRNTFKDLHGHHAVYNNQNSHNEYNLWYNNTHYNINRSRVGWNYCGAWHLEAKSGYYTRYNQFVNNIVHTNENKGFNSGDEGNDAYIINNEFRGNLMYNVEGVQINRLRVNMTFSAAHTNYPAEFGVTLTSDPKLYEPENGNFTLQGGSPAIDAGVWLTKIISTTGSGTTFAVSNPHFFYDGWGIPGETGDVIKTENGQVATITSIDYGLKKITVNTSINWTQGEGIALNYKGIKPDIGAFEYSYGISLSPPTSLTILAN